MLACRSRGHADGRVASACMPATLLGSTSSSVPFWRMYSTAHHKCMHHLLRNSTVTKTGPPCGTGGRAAGGPCSSWGGLCAGVQPAAGCVKPAGRQVRPGSADQETDCREGQPVRAAGHHCGGHRHAAGVHLGPTQGEGYSTCLDNSLLAQLAICARLCCGSAFSASNSWR